MFVKKFRLKAELHAWNFMRDARNSMLTVLA